MIAILLSTYNGECYLKEQIYSLLCQTRKDWCLFIRDDGSSDNTLQIIDTYLHKYPEKIFRLKDSYGNLKPAASFMQLLSEIDADYYMFCDQDDIWLPTKIEKTYKAISAIESSHPLVPVIIFSDLHLVDTNAKSLGVNKWTEEAIEPEKATDFYYLLACPAITGCTMMINKSVKEKVLPYIPPLMHDRWIPLIISECGIISFIPEALILYRIHDNNSEGVKIRKWSHYMRLLFNIRLSVKRWKDSFERYRSLPYKISKFKYICSLTFVVCHRMQNIKRMK